MFLHSPVQHEQHPVRGEPIYVEILPGKDGLLHISEIDWKRYETMDGVLEVGEVVKVKLIDVDKKTGKLKLSRKVLMPRPEKTNDAPSAQYLSIEMLVLRKLN